MLFRLLYLTHGMSSIVGIVATAVGTAALLRAGRAPDAGRLRRRARRASWLGLVAAVFLAGTLGTGIGLLHQGWTVGRAWLIGAFVEGAVLVVLAAVVVRPRLRALRQAVRDGGREPVDEATAALAADPVLRTGYIAVPVVVFQLLFVMFERFTVLPVVLLGTATAAVLAVFGLGQAARARVRASQEPAPSDVRTHKVVRRALVPAVVVGLAAWGVHSYSASKMPAEVSMGGSMADMPGMTGGVEISTLVGQASSGTVRKFTLTAARTDVRLDSGAVEHALTFNGASPGPRMVVEQGDLVDVTLVNHLDVPTSIHWHGVDVPGAEDGVSGVTQDAVKPGASFEYKFTAATAGTYWYHSHEEADTQIAAGLYGTLTVLPAGTGVPAAPGATDTAGDLAAAPGDLAVSIHTWNDGKVVLNDSDKPAAAQVAPGTQVRVRMVNTDSLSHDAELRGTSYTVAAMDAGRLDDSVQADGTRVPVAAGGRNDLTFTMPATPVTLRIGSSSAALVLAPSGSPQPASWKDGPVYDFTAHLVPDASGLSTKSAFNDDYTVNLDQRPGFHNGKIDMLHQMNGQSFPDTPMLMVGKGDVVEITYRNRTMTDHPMHLHGHEFAVLAHNGKALPPSSTLIDTLDIKTGDTWTIAFRADNPGIWMAHCHNLAHASMGMDMMVVYRGVSSRFQIGTASGNIPE
jgi:FtsP/CotA-like multicopper oxidase with cupredoxin domain